MDLKEAMDKYPPGAIEGFEIARINDFDDIKRIVFYNMKSGKQQETIKFWVDNCSKIEEFTFCDFDDLGFMDEETVIKVLNKKITIDDNVSIIPLYEIGGLTEDHIGYFYNYYSKARKMHLKKYIEYLEEKLVSFKEELKDLE